MTNRDEHPCVEDEKPDNESAGDALPAAPRFVLRLDGLPATPESVARVHKRVAEINQRLQQSGAPLRLRVM